MRGFEYHLTRVLIWGKTYPELSYKHTETVCTGGCLQDGTPIRLYPIKLRYLEHVRQYALYDWIEVPICKNRADNRPESYKVQGDRIEVLSSVPTGGDWESRRAVIFRNTDWHYECLNDLRTEQKNSYRSLGIIRVGEVLGVDVVRRKPEDEADFQKRLARLQSSIDLWGNEVKSLTYIPYRIRLHWRCQRVTGPQACPGHHASILDWGLQELARKEGIEKARAKMEALTRLDTYDLHLYMGNLFTRQNIFCIIGLWYPKRRVQASLFEAQ
jgi:hypothetical protein